LCLIGASDAAADDVSKAELSELAARAGSDPAALSELRAVTSVEGTPVDLETALAGAEGEELNARLESLSRSAESVAGEGVDAAEAREQVAGIFAEEDPEPPPSPDEERGATLSAPSLPVALLIGILALAVAAIVAANMGRRTILEREEAADVLDGAERPRSRDLGREADEAEHRGDFAAAVRLRFRAGLVRLDELGSIELRPSLTASGAVRESGLEAIGALASPYEEIAFGGRAAAQSDAEAQRRGWTRVLEEARRR